MLRLWILAAMSAWALFTSDAVAAGGPAAAGNVCEREMQAAAARYEVPLAVLYAVGLTESGRRQSLQPLAMNLAGTAYFAADLDDALRTFSDAQARGVTLIDVGCMQINHRYHGARFPSVAAMFDPRANVDYGARFLSQLRQQEGSWTLAVARYHAGPDNDPAQKKYVCAVIANMVATGFGGWTPAARLFCAGSKG
jgi:soluble lytic murein transglycosylase-like protein